jgi:hypothetical protein
MLFLSIEGEYHKGRVGVKGCTSRIRLTSSVEHLAGPGAMNLREVGLSFRELPRQRGAGGSACAILYWKATRTEGL